MILKPFLRVAILEVANLRGEPHGRFVFMEFTHGNIIKDYLEIAELKLDQASLTSPVMKN